jgi:hypothetical protein
LLFSGVSWAGWRSLKTRALALAGRVPLIAAGLEPVFLEAAEVIAYCKPRRCGAFGSGGTGSVCPVGGPHHT